ncbi:hypothetical protein WT81_10400 [Burkholderia stagnalis]|nr:hypothetical protein WT80_27800 [Burkholderia stagnalis]KWK61130.1 hypothetical protein WT81_10400 [Burkholderia stagnalis]KWN76690.1 hypothetical protein WT90_09060 [Burkholderia stagnalis]
MPICDLCLNSAAAGVEGGLVVLAAVEDAEDGGSFRRVIDEIRDDRAAALMGDAQSGKQVVAMCAAMGKRPEGFAIGDDRVDVAGRGQRHSALGNERLERVEAIE